LETIDAQTYNVLNEILQLTFVLYLLFIQVFIKNLRQ